MLLLQIDSQHQHNVTVVLLIELTVVCYCGMVYGVVRPDLETHSPWCRR